MDILNTHSSLDSWVGTLAWRSLRTRPLLVRTRHLSTRSGITCLPVALPDPAAIITTGKVTKDLLMERLGCRAAGYSLSHRVELTEFAPQEKSRELLAQVQIPSDASSSQCGGAALLEGPPRSPGGFHTLLEQGARAFLLLVGEGPYRVVIEEKIAQLGIQQPGASGGVSGPGAPWFALMDVKVLASYANEGVPQSLLQALAMARPVVGTTVGGIPEVIVEAETGLLVPPRDPRSLAQAMGRLMADPGLPPGVGDPGRELVIEKFSMEQMAAEIETVYEALRLRREGRAGMMPGAFEDAPPRS